MIGSGAPRVRTLIVRVWKEGGQGGGADGWRGEIRPVPGDDLYYFQGMERMVELIRSLGESEECDEPHG